MKIVKKAALVALVAIMAGCSSTPTAKVNFDRNEQISTANYKTFAWLTPSKILAAPIGINSVAKVRIDKAIEAAFIAKGYQLIESADDADFTVSYTVGSRDKIRVDTYPASYRTGFGWGRGYYGGFAMGTESTVRSYTEGKLAIDVFDVKTKQPVWHGWGTKRVTSSDKDDPTTTINAVVDQIIMQFN